MLDGPRSGFTPQPTITLMRFQTTCRAGTVSFESENSRILCRVGECGTSSFGDRMRWVALWLLLCGISLAAATEEPLPPDVKAFVEQRDLCDHFRGEPYEGASDHETVDQKDRREFVIASQQRYCPGTDKRLAELKLKYRDDRKVLDRLNRYEEQIEPQPR
jgi:hypothetical protein